MHVGDLPKKDLLPKKGERGGCVISSHTCRRCCGKCVKLQTLYLAACSSLTKLPDDSRRDADRMEEQWAKPTLATVIWGCGFVGGSLPLLCNVDSAVLGIGSAFGGGVFVAAGAIHLLPDTSGELDTGGYPVSCLIVSSTIVMIMVFEALAAHYTKAARARSESRHEGAQRESWLDAGPLVPLGHEEPFVHVSGGRATRMWTAGAMFVGLSFHSLMAGLSLGVLVDGSKILSAFAAIIAHKTIAAFALGAAFVRSRDGHGRALTRQQVLLWVFVFSLVTPLGVLIGAAAGSVADTKTAAALTAVAAGTFLYVGLLEIASKELQCCEHEAGGGGAVLGKAVALAVGFAAMAVLALWV
jgi:zinc transporter 1/2/3